MVLCNQYWLNAQLMKKAHQFLVSKGKVSSSEESFKQQLYDLWFKVSCNQCTLSHCKIPPPPNNASCMCNSFTGGRERLRCMTQVGLNMCLWERQEETMKSSASITGSSSTCRRRLAMWTTRDTSLAPRWGWHWDTVVCNSDRFLHKWISDSNGIRV